MQSVRTAANGHTWASCPEAIQERHLALELFEAIGEVYYNRWLETGEILSEALADCIEAK